MSSVGHCPLLALLRSRSSQTAVGAGSMSVEAPSSLLTGSSLLHTASSMFNSSQGEGCQYNQYYNSGMLLFKGSQT